MEHNVTDVTNLEQSELFVQNLCGVTDVDSFLDGILRSSGENWSDINDIALDVFEKVKSVCEVFSEKCRGDSSLLSSLQVSVECILLNRLHGCIEPVIFYQYAEKDAEFFNKCKELSNSRITAEQFGAPCDYAIPLSAAIVELASLDCRKSPVEKVHCLCTTYDLVFAELKSAIVEIISRSSDKDDEIPVIENCDIMPVLMTVVVRSKLLHLHSHMCCIDVFLWKLKESESVTATISVFKSTIDKIMALTDDNLQPGCEKICRDLDLGQVMQIMAELEEKRKKGHTSRTLLDLHIERVSDLISASTFANY